MHIISLLATVLQQGLLLFINPSVKYGLLRNFFFRSYYAGNAAFSMVGLFLFFTSGNMNIHEPKVECNQFFNLPPLSPQVLSLIFHVIISVVPVDLHWPRTIRHKTFCEIPYHVGRFVFLVIPVVSLRSAIWDLIF